MFKVTEEWLDAYRTARGGWTRRQLVVVGEEWPPRAGWKKEAVGCTISEVGRELFEAESHLSKLSDDTAGGEAAVARMRADNQVALQMAGYAIREHMGGEFPISCNALRAAIEAYLLYSGR